jgi:hypothetical protein
MQERADARAEAEALRAELADARGQAGYARASQHSAAEAAAGMERERAQLLEARRQAVTALQSAISQLKARPRMHSAFDVLRHSLSPPPSCRQHARMPDAFDALRRSLMPLLRAAPFPCMHHAASAHDHAAVCGRCSQHDAVCRPEQGVKEVCW